jgi:hypothetical protein
MKSLKYLTILGSLVAAATLSAEWTLLDDFENGLDKWNFSNHYAEYTLRYGEPDGSWGITPRPFDSEGGNVLAVSEGLSFNNQLWAWMDIGAMPTDNVYTLFSEKARFDLSSGGAFGLVPLALNEIVGFDENDEFFESGWSAYNLVARDGRSGLNAYNGSKYEPRYSDGEAQTWYKMWFVIDPFGLTYSIYIQGGEFTEQTLVADTYDWRNFTDQPNRTFVWRTLGNDNTNTSNGEPNHLDNLFVDLTGANLSDPTEGQVNDPTWGGYPITNGSANTGEWMGWLNVASAPFVYSYSLDTWFFLPEPAAGAPGGWAYLLKSAASDGLTGENTWGGYPVQSNAANTGSWMGLMDITSAPYVYNYTMSAWIFLPEPATDAPGAWGYIFK